MFLFCVPVTLSVVAVDVAVALAVVAGCRLGVRLDGMLYSVRTKLASSRIRDAFSFLTFV